MLRLCLPLLLLFTLVAPGLAAAEDDVATAWTALQAEAAERLADLARAAHAKRLFLTRDEVYAEVLLFAPDHAKARSWLKYKRRDGTWERGTYRRPHNRGSKAARNAQAVEASAWRAWWRAEVLRLHGQAEAAGATNLADEVLRFALVFQSEDPAIRALAGEGLYGEGLKRRWVLLETKRALDNRARFLAAAREAARKVAPPTPVPPTPEDRPKVVPWTHGLEGPRVRAVGSVAPEELARHHELAASASAVFAAVFGVEAHLPSGTEDAPGPFPLYVAATRREGNAFLAGEEGVGTDGLALLEGLDLVFLPTRPGALVKAENASLRLEATVHAVQAHLTRPHLGHRPGARGAWAQEAVALYLAWLQVRTRDLLTAGDPVSASGPPAASEPQGPFGRPRHGSADDAVEFEGEATDWHARAAEAIRNLPLAEFRQTSRKRAADLDALDLMAAYGLAVYVLEAHPTASAAFFRTIASQTVTDLDAALEAHLDTNLEQLRPHLLRWLDEMGALAPPPGEVR